MRQHVATILLALLMLAGCDSEPAEKPDAAAKPGDGMIEVPFKALDHAKQVALQMQIQDALRAYKASNPEAKGPASHEEFMEKVVRQYHISLPNPPPGCHYVYDPLKEELTTKPNE